MNKDRRPKAIHPVAHLLPFIRSKSKADAPTPEAKPSTAVAKKKPAARSFGHLIRREPGADATTWKEDVEARKRADDEAEKALRNSTNPFAHLLPRNRR